jgi:hypothetical protein
MMQQRALAASANPEYGHDLAVRNGEIDAFEHLRFAVGKMQITDFD